MEMTYLDQILMLGLFIVFLLAMAFCVGWVIVELVMRLVFSDSDAEQSTDQVDAVWQTIEDECRRMREAGIAD